MRKICLGFAVVLALFHGAIPLAQARTGYVSDMLILTFREGPSKNYAVKKSLQSNTPVIILEEKEGYLNVRLESGEVGWVEKQYIVFTQPKTMLIEQLKKENQRLEAELASTTTAHEAFKNRLSDTAQEGQEKAASLTEQLKEAESEIASLKQQLSTATSKYTTLVEQSGNVQKIAQENKVLTRKNTQLEKDIAQLEDQAGSQFRTAMIKWFLAGVGVLLVGWILGHSVSSKKRRKSSLLD